MAVKTKTVEQIDSKKVIERTASPTFFSRAQRNSQPIMNPIIPKAISEMNVRSARLCSENSFNTETPNKIPIKRCPMT